MYKNTYYLQFKDSHTLVDKRFRTGLTMNLATKAGKVLLVFTAATLLLIPILCIWLIFEEFTPVHLEIYWANITGLILLE